MIKTLQIQKQAIHDKYESAAHFYDQMEGFTEWLGVRTLREKLYRNARGKILEVAVGTGKNLPYYPADSEVVGVDFSPAMLDVAATQARRSSARITLKPMDAERLEFADGTFDTVTSSMSLCTFTDPVQALQEMVRVCHPQGRILLLEHGRSDHEWLGRFQDYRASEHVKPLGCHWNREPLKLVEQAGLTVINAQRSFFGIFHVIEAAPKRVLLG